MAEMDDVMVGKRDSIWEYMAVLHPTKAESKDGIRSKVLLDRTQILAASESECLIQAHRKLGDEVMDKLDRVEVAVRMF